MSPLRWFLTDSETAKAVRRFRWPLAIFVCLALAYCSERS